MRPRFIILICKSNEERELLAARTQRRTGFELVTTANGSALLVDTAASVVRFGNGGAIIGRLFHRHGFPEQITTLSSDVSEAITRSCGRELIDRYWGAYVALIPTIDGYRVLRDPSAAQPCLSVSQDSNIAFGSDAGILVHAGFLVPSICWNGIGRNLYTNGLPSTETGLEGLEELTPGFAVHVQHAKKSHEQLWDPWNYVTIDENFDGQDRAESLFRTIHSTVQTQAEPHARILIGVSGGLDSSIVAASLKSPSINTHCLTIATKDADGDERRYARILCDGLGLPLEERFYAHEDVDIMRGVAPHLPRPTSRSISLPYDMAVARVVRDLQINAFYTGNGGDNVFAFSMSATSVLDRYYHEGVGLGVLRSLKDVCNLTGCGPWQALRQLLRTAGTGTRGYAWRAEPLYLHEQLVAEQKTLPITHPWLDAPDGALPGKAVHIALLLRLQQHLQASEWGIQAEVITPLMAQPVIEACLHIPSWEWCRGGVNRASARRAFKAHLPAEIVHRTTKGGPNNFANQIIDRNRAQICERLVYGQLSKQGIIDGLAIERSLSAESPNFSLETVRLLGLLEAEAWIDYWRTGPPPDDRLSASLIRSAFSASQSITSACLSGDEGRMSRSQ